MFPATKPFRRMTISDVLFTCLVVIAAVVAVLALASVVGGNPPIPAT